MIYNIFSYPSSFGRAQIYKCDLYGNRLSKTREIYIDGISASINEPNTDDAIFFGGFNQSSTFLAANRDITLTASFITGHDLSGVISPGVDLIMNCSAWSYQGTTVPYKLLLDSLTTSSLVYLNQYIVSSIGLTNSNYQYFRFYLVDETSSVLLDVSSINTISRTIEFTNNVTPGDQWLEIICYGLDQDFPLYQEPMFRIDSSEGSFFPCLIDSLNFKVEGESLFLSASIKCINFDRGTRLKSASSFSRGFNVERTIPIHKSRIRIVDGDNRVAGDFGLTDINDLDYMNYLVDISLSHAAITEFNFNINNQLSLVHNNRQTGLKRTYVSGYYAGLRKIDGSVTTLFRRGSEGSFDQFPTLGPTALNLLLGGSKLSFDNVVWSHESNKSVQGSYTENTIKWRSLADQRQSQPVFETTGAFS